MALLTLREQEKIILEISGDYWIGNRQSTGIFEVTDFRMAFRYKTILGRAKENAVELELANIATVDKCNVGGGLIKLVPTGIKVTTKSGETYIFSVLKRDKLISALKNEANI